MFHQDAGRHFMQAISGFMFFEGFTRYISPLILQHFPAVQNLSRNDKEEFHARNTSSLHSFIVGIVCVYALLADDNSKKDLLWGDSWIIRSNLAISIGFFLSDFRYVITHMEAGGGGWGYICHHVSAIWPYSLVALSGCLSYFANFRLLAELSTPFVNLRWYYAVTGQKDSIMYYNNGLVMVGSFFLCRIIVMPYYWYLVYSVTGTEAFERLGLVYQVSLYVPCIALDFLNVLWFKKMVKGALKVLAKGRPNDVALPGDPGVVNAKPNGNAVVDGGDGVEDHPMSLDSRSKTD